MTSLNNIDKKLGFTMLCWHKPVTEVLDFHGWRHKLLLNCQNKHVILNYPHGYKTWEIFPNAQLNWTSYFNKRWNPFKIFKGVQLILIYQTYHELNKCKTSETTIYITIGITITSQHYSALKKWFSVSRQNACLLFMVIPTYAV